MNVKGVEFDSDHILLPCPILIITTSSITWKCMPSITLMQKTAEFSSHRELSRLSGNSWMWFRSHFLQLIFQIMHSRIFSHHASNITVIIFRAIINGSVNGLCEGKENMQQGQNVNGNCQMNLMTIFKARRLKGISCECWLANLLIISCKFNLHEISKSCELKMKQDCTWHQVELDD